MSKTKQPRGAKNMEIISEHSDRHGRYFLVREADGTEQVYREEELA